MRASLVSWIPSTWRTTLVAAALVVGAAPSTWATTYSVGSTQASATQNGTDLRNTLKIAQLGDVILLAAGAVFEGPFQLTQKSGSGYLTIRTSALDSDLPPGTRVSPSNVALMPRLVPLLNSTNTGDVVISTAQAAGYYDLIGLQIASPRYLYNLVTLGTGSERSWQQMAHHIGFDRCYFQGSSAAGTRRGIAANAGQGSTASSGNTANDGSQDDIVITNSFFADFKDAGSDSQAVAAWNGYGPFRFENNYFEGAGENVMFGGGDPSIRGLVPSNITIHQNHFYKPLSWFNDGAQAGTWIVKNLFELKNAQYVVIDSNVFEHNWEDLPNGQNGMGILFTPRNQSGRCTWCVVQSVIFQNNILRHSAGGMNILGTDDINRSRQLNHVTIQNNLFQDISDTNWRSSTTATSVPGRLFEIENKADHVTIDHNTGLQTKAVTYSWEAANSNFVFTNNVVAHNYCPAGSNNCGMAGDSASPGLPALNLYFVNPYNVTYNVMYQGNEAGQWSYPATNAFPQSVAFTCALSSTCDTDSSDYTQTTYLDSSRGSYSGINESLYTATKGVVQYTNP